MRCLANESGVGEAGAGGAGEQERLALLSSSPPVRFSNFGVSETPRGV